MVLRLCHGPYTGQGLSQVLQPSKNSEVVKPIWDQSDRWLKSYDQKVALAQI